MLNMQQLEQNNHCCVQKQVQVLSLLELEQEQVLVQQQVQVLEPLVVQVEFQQMSK